MNTTLLAAALVTSATSIGSASSIHGDIEVDPTAYVLDGYSLHVGIGYEHLRLDLGNFAMELPQFVHGDDGFNVAFDGYGAKLQYWVRSDQTGLFAGIDAGVVRVHAHLQGSDLSADDTQIGAGVHAGYRLSLPAGFYATAWLGVGYAFSADNVMLGGKTYDASPFSVFPAIHLGYRFQ